MSKFYDAGALDADFYRSHYPDLAPFSPDQARAHYEAHGRQEGRAYAAGASRETLAALIPDDRLVLEIGPYARPFVTGEHVRYADVFSTEELQARAGSHDFRPEDCPTIHYNLQKMSLRDIPERFGAAFSSHCIEHQPDLIAHLNDVAAVLEPGARYIVVAPDKRYCFDHFRSASTTIGVVAAYIDGRRTNSTETILSQLTLIAHNDSARHWNGEHGQPPIHDSDATWHHAIKSLQSRGPDYIDAHAWQFTAETFAGICGDLERLGLINLSVEAVFDTPHNRHEFCALFRRI